MVQYEEYDIGYKSLRSGRMMAQRRSEDDNEGKEQ